MDGLEVGDEEFLDIAKDPARARSLRTSLRRLAEGRDEVLREMAREVLAGRAGLRDVARTGAYREALREMNAVGMRAYEQLSAEERSAAEAEGRRQREEYQGEIDRERVERRPERQEGGRGSGGRGGALPHQARGWRL